MPRPSNDQILELWRDSNASARIDEPAPPTDLVIVSFADALLDKWQYSEKDTNLDNLFDNSNWIWADEEEGFEQEMTVFN